MRLLNPTVADLAAAIEAAATLQNVQVAEANRLKGINNSDLPGGSSTVAEYVATAATGFFEAYGSGKEGEKVAAISVAWYTRLNGVKVVQLQAATPTVTREGDVETPSLVPAKYHEPLLAAGGYAVLASERLSAMFRAMRRAAQFTETAPAAEAVLKAPGDLTAWKALADAIVDAPGGSEVKADLYKAIGA